MYPPRWVPSPRWGGEGLALSVIPAWWCPYGMTSTTLVPAPLGGRVSCRGSRPPPAVGASMPAPTLGDGAPCAFRHRTYPAGGTSRNRCRGFSALPIRATMKCRGSAPPPLLGIGRALPPLVGGGSSPQTKY